MNVENGALKVMYTNIDGLLSGVLELKDYLEVNRPEVVCLAETKLKQEVQLNFKNEGYNIWRRDRKDKGGGGVLIMVKKDIYVEDVQYGKDMAEVISVVIKNSKGERRRVILTYVPPKTNAWRQEEHRRMQEEVWQCLDDMIRRNKKVLLVGDFNCKGVNWEEMEVKGGEGVWSEKLLQLALVNTMDQWVDEATRYRGEEEPSVLDLVFTKRPEVKPIIEYTSPIGKSDHVVLEVEMQDMKAMKWKEDHKNGRLNHARANFEELRKFFGNIDWKNVMKDLTVQEKYELFLEKYNEGVQKYVPVYRVRESKYSWFNGRCVEAKKRKDKAWKKWMKNRNDINREQYRNERNEYVRIRREEERSFERDIVQKCEKEPKLFYRYINGKMKSRETIDKLEREGRIYETAKETSELMNESFKSVFNVEEEFVESIVEERQEGLQEVRVERQEIGKLLEKLDVRKAMGPDGVSGWTLRECREQLVEPIWDVISSSLKEGKVPREWKRANIVPIYKGGKKTEPLNYRPVSLTSVVGKLCETVIKERWVSYLEENKVINESQFGFRKGRSCVTNLLSFYTSDR